MVEVSLNDVALQLRERTVKANPSIGGLDGVAVRIS